jgi:hypothetical protein
MRGIGIILREQMVQAMFGINGKIGWKVQAKLTQTRRANRDQERFDGFAPRAQILNSGIN